MHGGPLGSLLQNLAILVGSISVILAELNIPSSWGCKEAYSPPTLLGCVVMLFLSNR